MKPNRGAKPYVGMTDSIVVGYDYTEATDNAVLIVGKKLPDNSVDIINAFQGDEAKKLWAKLTTAKE
jgi:hypothetical protein